MDIVIETGQEEKFRAVVGDDFLAQLQLRIARIADELSRSAERHGPAVDRDLWRRAEEPCIEELFLSRK